MEPSTVLYNGIVRTLVPGEAPHTAVAIWDDRLFAVGDDSLRQSLRRHGQAVDLEGRLVLPGFIDSHIHFAEYALRQQRVDLSGTRSLEEALSRVREAVSRTPPGEWILGGGWDRNLWDPPHFPTRRDLDGVSCGYPIALDSKDVHSLWVNSLALSRAGIGPATPDPAGGKIVREGQSGEPTGVLNEMPAKALIWEVVPPPSLEQLCGAMKAAFPSAWQQGITGIHDCEGPDVLSAFQELRRRGELGLRTLVHLTTDTLEHAIAAGVRTGLGDEWVRIGGVKIFMDGALGSHTAWMFDPYMGEPANCGVETTTREELRHLLEPAFSHGISAAIHAIGDRANHNALDVLEEILESHPAARELPNRIEHAQLLAPADIPRFGRLGIIASVQPTHLTADFEMVERYWGPTRGQGAYAFRSLLDAGTRLTFGSDCPVERMDALGSLYAAAARRRPDGSPGPEGWHPQERIPPEEAILAGCVMPAIASGEGHLKGRLAPGMLADMVVLSHDLLAIPVEEWPAVRVHGTILGGQLVYRAPEWR